MSPPYGIAEKVCESLWGVSWQVAVLIAVVAIASLVFRRAPANFRYGLWCIVLARLCIPAELSLPLGFGVDVRETAGAYTRSLVAPLLAPAGATENAAPPRAAAPSRPSAVPRNATLALGWLGVAGAAAGLVLIRGRQARRLLQTCRPVEREELEALMYRLRERCGVRRSVSLGLLPESAQPKGPCVTGILTPCVLLPRQMAEQWSLDELEPVLLHELAHVKRLDLLVNLVQIAVQIVYFFHPLVWLANRRIRALREEVCDDMAVLHIQRQKKRYGSSFLRVIEETQREPALALWPLQMSEARNSLGRRVVRIMSKDYVYHRRLGLGAFTALAAVAVIAVGAAGVSGKSNNVMDQAQKLFDQKQYDEAISLLQQTYEKAPRNHEALQAMEKLGLFYMWLDEDQKAADLLEQAVAKFQRGGEAAWFYLGEAYNRLGRTDDALAAWERSIELSKGRVRPDQFPYMQAVGNSMLVPAEKLYEAKEYEKAIEAYTRIYTELPKWNNASHAMMMVGLCYGWMGEEEKALKSLELAAEKYPDVVGWSEATWYYLGERYERAARPEQALKAYRKSVDLAKQCVGRKPDKFPWAHAAERIAALEK
ncbi:MAG TPA: M56 family metallopeptidase [Candidatus Bathyarchaeia archaeon]|nr:M56 family metallopeptidase [Candidatus Bathyarchaeia archaeon]